MNRKFFNVLVVITISSVIFFSGCEDLVESLANRLHEPEELSLEGLDKKLEEIMDLPYSELTSEEQKVKLEQESIELLNALEAASSLQAIDIFEYFVELLDMDEPDVAEPVKEGKAGVWELFTFDATYSYGVFTWNSSTEKWRKTSSGTELKFVFPSNEDATSNNASLTLNSKNSNSNIVYEDSFTDNEFSEYSYNERFVINLPSTVTGILSVGNKEIAKIEFGAEYEKSDKITVDEGEYIDDYYDETWIRTIQGSYPVATKLRISTDEGFVFWYSVDGKGKDSRVEMQLSNKDGVLIESLFALDIDFKSLVNEASDDIENLLDLDKTEANGYIKLLKELVLIYEIDAANLAKDIDEVESKYENLYNYPKAYYDEIALALNNHMDVVLASIIDEGYIIANIVYRTISEEYGDYYISPFLKFGDGTEAEMEAYFGSGFSAFEQRWEDFLDAFNRE